MVQKALDARHPVTQAREEIGLVQRGARLVAAGVIERRFWHFA
jgi:hypothetical protein